MKKLFIVLIAIVSAISVNAQENVKKEKDLAVVVDSLTAKLNKLQNDYDYLYCTNELNDFFNKLGQLKQDISIDCNKLNNYIYNYKFEYSMYNALKRNYDSYINYFETLKEGRDATFGNIYLKILVSDFTDLQIKYLRHRMENEYPSAINSIETGLNLYKLCLDEYKKKW